MKRVHKIAIEETYNEVKDFIYSLCHKYQEEYGGDFDELVSIANLVFMEVYGRYVIEDGSFINWLKVKIWFRLIDEQRKDSKARRHRKYDERYMTLPDTKMVDLMDGLGKDAVKLINMIFNSPPLLTELIQKSKGDMRSIRFTLSNYLKSIGWSTKQIKISFKQIKDALLDDNKTV